MKISILLAAALVITACDPTPVAPLPSSRSCAVCDTAGVCHDEAGAPLGSCACIEADVAIPLRTWCESTLEDPSICADESPFVCNEGNAACCEWHMKVCANLAGSCDDVAAICAVCKDG